MSLSDDKRPSGCPITFGLDTFGDKWTLIIIREMMFNGKRTYGALLAADEGISTNILASRLKHLEAEGIVVKQRDLKSLRSFLYTLTSKGYDLAPILVAIIRWSGKYDERPTRLTDMVERVETDRSRLEKEIFNNREPSG